MFDKLGRAVTRHPWVFVVFWLVIAAGAGLGVLWGYGQGGLFDRLENSISLVPGSESDQVNKATSDAGGETVTIVVKGVDVKNQLADVTQFVNGHRTGIADAQGVIKQTDPFVLLSSNQPELQAQAGAMISANNDGFLMTVTLDPKLQDADQRDARDASHSAVYAAVDQFSSDLDKQFPGATATAVSMGTLGDAIVSQVQSDLVTGEAVSLPVALVLLIIIFGGLLAAGLPMLGAIISIVIGLGAVWGITFATTVDSFILNVISIIGVALSIDYGLLMVSRYREELRAELIRQGYPGDGSHVPRKYAAKDIVRTAARATVATAGRTVTFSAVTIACAMSALIPMNSPMLKTMAISGMVVTLLAVLMAVTVVPSLIVIMNRVLIQPSVLTHIPGVRQITRTLGDAASDRGFFSRLAQGVHRHPWWIMAGALVILAIMASPIRTLTMRMVFADYLPASSQVTQAYNTLQSSDYPYARQATIILIAQESPDKAANLVDGIKSMSPDIDMVAAPTPVSGDDTRSIIGVHVAVDDQAGKTVTDLVKQMRAHDFGVPVLVGGSAALQYDFIQSVVTAMPISLTIMICAVLLLLFLMTGSLIVPLKALIINSLSLVASLGTTWFIFEHGYLGMPKVPGMEAFIVVCGICFGFGLAMDYEVFLLARIKEYWDAGHPNDQAVEMGLQRSGRIITSAAAIIVAVFIGFTAGEMGAIKQVGVMLAVTVVTDATLVRLLLVPATMTVLGKWNWWAPPPLRFLYKHMRIIH